MKLTVRCRCKKQRSIDTDKVGPWRLRCKGCGDILYDPQVAPLPAEVADPAEDTQFYRHLQGSRELNVLNSSDDEDTPPCAKHPQRRVVAACTRCSRLLCKHCLDRFEDTFVCAECVAKAVSGKGDDAGGLRGWLKRILG